MAHVYRNRATGEYEPAPRSGVAYEKVTHLSEEQAAEYLAHGETGEPANKELDVSAPAKGEFRSANLIAPEPEPEPTKAKTRPRRK